MKNLMAKPKDAVFRQRTQADSSMEVGPLPNEAAKYAGKDARLSGKDMQMNANMTNTGYTACELGKSLTNGLDKTAFPVR